MNTAKKQAILRLFKLTALTFAILPFVVSRAFSQGPSQEQIEKARRMGISKDMKIPAEWLTKAGTHYSATPPSNFPITIYSSNVIKSNFVNTTQGAPAATVNIITRDKGSIVNQFYMQELRARSFALAVPSAEAQAKMGDRYMMSGRRDKETVMLSISPINYGGQTATNVGINWAVGN